MNYFIKVEGESYGPLSADELRKRLAHQQLKELDFVRREDSTAWVPLCTLDEFKDLLQPVRPLANPMAWSGLVLGVVSIALLLASIPWFLVTMLGAIILSHLAMRKIGRNFHSVSGYGMAGTGMILGYLTLAGSLVAPLFTRECAKAPMTKAIINCRAVITTLRLYSFDSSGNYPDADRTSPRTSNDAFRLLFVSGQADNEMIFGSPASIFNPDGNIGKAPDYAEALKPGENHWAMTKGLGESMAGNYPLVCENPSVATWPPQWDPDLAGTGKPGRTWSGGKVIIGMNDNSVSLQKLESHKGVHVGLQPLADGKPFFPTNNRELSILNVARP